MLLLFSIKLVKLKIINDTVTSITGKKRENYGGYCPTRSNILRPDFLTREGVHARTEKIRSALADFERDTHIVDVVAKLK